MWVYQGKEFTEIPENYIGFVYSITCLVNDKNYFGKKNFYFIKYRTVKKKKKRYKAESDWKDYYSSSEELKADVELHGKDKFKREIIRLCKTKAEMGYYEAKIQFDKDCLLDINSYNSWISVRCRSAHLGIKK